MTPRKQQLIDLLELGWDIKSLLYVGARGMKRDKRARWWVDMCEENGIRWYMLEIFKANCDEAREVISPQHVIQGDIMDTEAYPETDCLIYWHGPEHIEKQAFVDNLPQIERKAGRLVIFGMPWGKHSQGVCYGNQHERHVSTWYPKEWEDLGYSVMTEGKGPDKKGHITAWKDLADG